jgi:hypothetical protein
MRINGYAIITYLSTNQLENGVARLGDYSYSPYHSWLKILVTT